MLSLLKKFPKEYTEAGIFVCYKHFSVCLKPSPWLRLQLQEECVCVSSLPCHIHQFCIFPDSKPRFVRIPLEDRALPYHFAKQKRLVVRRSLSFLNFIFKFKFCSDRNMKVLRQQVIRRIRRRDCVRLKFLHTFRSPPDFDTQLHYPAHSGLTLETS